MLPAGGPRPFPGQCRSCIMEMRNLRWNPPFPAPQICPKTWTRTGRSMLTTVTIVSAKSGVTWCKTRSRSQLLVLEQTRSVVTGRGSPAQLCHLLFRKRNGSWVEVLEQSCLTLIYRNLVLPKTTPLFTIVSFFVVLRTAFNIVWKKERAS